MLKTGPVEQTPTPFNLTNLDNITISNFSIFENTLVRITYNHYLTEEVTFLRETDQNKSLDFLLNPFRFMYVSLYNCMFVTINVHLNEINMFKPRINQVIV